jgi:hypothetical protein
MDEKCSMKRGRKMHKTFWLETVKGKDHSEDKAIDKRIILKWILGEKVRGCGMESCSSG